jgi:N-acetylglucosamine-6-phosphate deacetylase
VLVVTTLTGARVVTPEGVLDGAWVRVEGERIAEIGTGAASGPTVDLAGSWLLPGFVDLHVHGGGGYDVTRGASDMAAAVAFHRRHGVTSTLVSLMAQPVDAMCEQLGWIADLAASGVVIGAHLEGPFLSEARCGAQNPANLLDPDPLVLAKLIEAGQGSVRTVTIAPERPGALELISEVADAGIVAALGHTAATYEQAAAGLAAGATLATHLFNAMGPFSHRAPGPSVAALDSTAFLELINDGIHVHESLIRLVALSAPHRLAFITDAVSATGAVDGTYTLGDRSIVVRGGQATVSGSDRLAGSTLTMDAAVRRAVRVVGLPIEVAAAAAATNPARALGLENRCGAIRTGLAADFAVLDADLAIERVMAAGTWV